MSSKYTSETQKIRSTIERYLKGRVMDIGCGHDPVTQDAFGVDCRAFPHVGHLTRNLDRISEERPELVGQFDVVYSSHCLEHFVDDRAALRDWMRMLRPGGVLVLYLPDDRYYDNASNPEHVQRYEYERFMAEYMSGYRIKESGLDVGPDRYSFYVVAAP